MPLPPRQTGTGNPFSNFAGGGYFYLDHRDRAVVPTADRHDRDRPRAPGRRRCAGARRRPHRRGRAAGDAIIAVMPDWRGRIWFATHARRRRLRPALGRGRARWRRASRSGTRSRSTSAAASTSSPTRRSTGSRPGRGGVRTVWRARYPNIGVIKPGQTQAGSGTTPTLLGRRLVAITDNADPMAIRVYQRTRRARGRRLVCRQPVFEPGAELDRPVADRNRPLAGGREQLRLHGDRLDAERRDDDPGPRAGRPRPRRARVPHRLAQRRARAVGGPEALARRRGWSTRTRSPRATTSPTPGT